MDGAGDNKIGLLRHGKSALAYGPHYVGRAQEIANVALPIVDELLWINSPNNLTFNLSND